MLSVLACKSQVLRLVAWLLVLGETGGDRVLEYKAGAARQNLTAYSHESLPRECHHQIFGSLRHP